MSSKDTDEGDSNDEQMHPLARLHQESGGNGHWWSRFDAEPPDHTRETVTDDAPQRCTTVETPPVPDDVEWSEYGYYVCDGCMWPCINRLDSEAYEAGLCWFCVSDGELPDGRDITAKLF